MFCVAVQEGRRRDAPATTGDVDGASIEELNQKIHTLEKEKNKEEEYRNYMQLERVRVAGGKGPQSALAACPPTRSSLWTHILHLP